MGNSKKILINTLLLTMSSLAMRSIGMAFQVYLTNKINASGVGLFGLIMSVYTLFTTLAISGIRFATTRLVSEELGVSPNGKINRIVRNCLIYGLFFGTLASLIMISCARQIGVFWIKDSRCILSLRIISTSLPFLAMSAVLSGYFTAVGRVFKSALAQFLEQLTRIIIVVVLYTKIETNNLEIACAIIMLGGALGDCVSFLLQYFLYLFERKRYSAPRHPVDIPRRMVSIAFPLALSAYCRTALSTLQQLLVPVGFKKAGHTAEKALSDYGIIHGMVLSVLTFPSALFYSFSEIIVPELTAAQVCGNHDRIKNIVNRALRISTLVAIGLSAIFFRYSYELGNLLYGIEDVGKYMRILSLLMPIMYLDSVTDGLLRGLGEHMYNMWVNISDSLLSVIFVYTLLPKWAVNGYLFIICFTEIFNFCLSIYKLSKITKIEIRFRVVVITIFSALAAISITMLILRAIGLQLCSTVLSVSAHIIISLVIYFILIKLFNCIDYTDYNLLKSAFSKKEF